MTRGRALLIAAALGTSGCAAAVVPVAAAGVIARHRHKAAEPVQVAQAAPAPATPTQPAPAGAPADTLPPAPVDPGQMRPGQVYRRALPQPGQAAPVAALPGASGTPSPAPADAPSIAAAVPAGMQYLYASGEAAALAVESWRSLTTYVAAKVLARPRDSAVLAPGASLAAPTFVSCGDKPFAAVFDVDETVLLNLGYEADDAAHPGRAYSEARRQDWERTGVGKATDAPGAASALTALRTMGVAVIFNTNRSAANADATEATLAKAGLGAAKHGETLFLQGDDTTGPHKDARRAAIAARYCVLAMAGDQLGDFSDLFNAPAPPRARRAAALAPAVARLWGSGWFVMPNPVYGTALKGNAAEVFPASSRWTPQP